MISMSARRFAIAAHVTDADRTAIIGVGENWQTTRRAPMTDLVLTEIEDGIATLTLNRPEARNAVNVSLGGALRTALDRVEADPSIRIGILRGAGAAFSAGLDLKAVAAGQVQEVLEGEGGFGGLVRRVRTKPLIAAVGGRPLQAGSIWPWPAT